MATKETLVKKAVVKILDKHGAYHFFPATHGYGRSGVPDIVAYLRRLRSSQVASVVVREASLIAER